MKTPGRWYVPCITNTAGGKFTRVAVAACILLAILVRPSDALAQDWEGAYEATNFWAAATNASTRSDAYLSHTNYLEAHAWDQLNAAASEAFGAATLYGYWLELMQMGRGGRQQSNNYVFMRGEPLDRIELPGLELWNSLSERDIGQRMHANGGNDQIFFYDAAQSGWGISGKVPFVRLTWALVFSQPYDDPSPVTPTSYNDCYWIRRGVMKLGSTSYSFMPEGMENDCHAHIIASGSNYAPSCGTSYNSCAPQPPTRFRSNKDNMIFDVTNSAAPVLYLADGTKYIMNGGTSPWENPYDDPFLGMDYSAQKSYGPSKRISPNGEVTTFAWTTGSFGQATYTITDSRGRASIYDPGYNGGPTLQYPHGQNLSNTSWQSTWTIVGSGGKPLTYVFYWNPITYNPRTAFPELANDTALSRFCIDGNNPSFDQCGSRTVPTLTKITQPDGRSYQFSYGAWGNLLQSNHPDGLILKFIYGDPTTNLASGTAYANGFVPLDDGFQDPYNLYWAARLQSRTPMQLIQYPNGLSGPAYTTSRSNSLDAGHYLYWTRIVRPDGSVQKLAVHSGGSSAHASAPVAEEIWDASETKLLAATYYGDPSTGVLWIMSENTSALGPGVALNCPPPPMNTRQTKVQVVRDGMTVTTTTFSYDSFVIGGATFTSNNVPLTQVLDGAGNILVQTQTSYQTAAWYLNQNIVHLPLQTKILDPAGVVLSRVDQSYDDFALSPSSEPGLDTTYTNAYRGNPTKTTRYTDPVGGAGAVVSKAFYFDNGVTKSTQNPIDGANGRSTTNVVTFNFGSCASSPTVQTTVQDALGHAITTVGDCYSGLPLSVVDANSERTCTQYDWLDRPVETAVPGDTLSSLPTSLSCESCSVTSAPLCGETCNTCTYCAPVPACNNTGSICGPCGTQVTQANCQYCGGTPKACTITNCSVCGWSAGGYERESSCATNTGTVVGAGGAGPTTWMEYYPLGLGGVTYNQARTVAHSMDGTANGHYVTTFIDGLGRAIQQCVEKDATYEGGKEACSTTSYDGMGRVYQTYVPFAANPASPPSVQVATGPAGTQYTQNTYDGAGRITASQFIWPGGSLSTGTSYTAASSGWITMMTDPNGCDTRAVTNALGQVVEHDAQNNGCAQAPTWDATTLHYDAAGRLLWIKDPALNQVSFQYDGLGRKTQMIDPDMGTWRYDYDANGNLIRQTDGRGAAILLAYDALNRIVIKNLPVGNGTTWVTGGTLPGWSASPTTDGEEDEVYFYDGALPASCSGGCNDHCPTTTDTCNTATMTCSHTGTACSVPCIPTTSCFAQSKNCGSIPDGCGGTLNCGGCAAPQTCGGGGTPNVCGCTPTTCAAQGKNCGSFGDGCGGMLNCGSCTAPQTCGGGGTANICGCTPKTCAGLAKNCGSVSDGCGGMLNCGSCTAPQSCGGGGTANVCGCTPSCSGKTCGTGDGCGGTCCAGGGCTQVACTACHIPNACGSACVVSPDGTACTGLTDQCISSNSCVSGTCTKNVNEGNSCTLPPCSTRFVGTCDSTGKCTQCGL